MKFLLAGMKRDKTTVIVLVIEVYSDDSMSSWQLRYDQWQIQLKAQFSLDTLRNFPKRNGRKES